MMRTKTFQHVKQRRKASAIAAALFAVLGGASAHAGVMMQGFYKDVPSPAAGTSAAPWLWDNLAGQANAMRQAGFSPDYYLDLNGGGTPYTFYVGYATVPTGGGAAGTYLGNSQTTGATTTLTGGDANTLGIQAAIDNSNTAGVGGAGGSTTGAGLVRTGIEFGIPLSAIGNPTGPINIAAFINGSNADFLSNQVLGGIGGGGNLDTPSGVNFSSIAGNQFFTVTQPAAAPEPSGIASLLMGALVLGGLVAVRRRTASVTK